MVSVLFQHLVENLAPSVCSRCSSGLSRSFGGLCQGGGAQPPPLLQVLLLGLEQPFPCSFKVVQTPQCPVSSEFPAGLGQGQISLKAHLSQPFLFPALAPSLPPWNLLRALL